MTLLVSDKTGKIGQGNVKEEVWAISTLGNNFTKLNMGKTLETIFATFTKLELSKFNPRLQDKP